MIQTSGGTGRAAQAACTPRTAARDWPAALRASPRPGVAAREPRRHAARLGHDPAWARAARQPRALLRPQYHPQEELSVGVLVPGRPRPPRRPARGVACAGPRRDAVDRGVVQSRFPFGAVLRRPPDDRAALCLDAQSPAAERARLSGPGCRRPQFLLLQRGHSPRGSSQRDLSLHHLLAPHPRRKSAAIPSSTRS